MSRKPLFADSDRVQPCNLCQRTDFARVGELDRRGNPLETVLCRSCGLVSHGSIPDDDELAAYYEGYYRQDYHGEFTPSAYRVLREWKRGEQLVKLLGNSLPPAARVIEIGSGIGCTVKNFEAAGFQARGIEPGQGFCQFSRAALSADVEQISLDQLPGSADQQLVLLVHVLEHLNDPSAALRTLRELMAEDGLCYIEVPNFTGPHAAPGKQFHFAHIYNYSATTLSMLAHANGLVVERVISLPTDKNLQVLLAKGSLATDSDRLHIDPTSFPLSTKALTQYTTLRYYLRWRYIRERVSTLLRQWGNRWRATARLEQLLNRCQATNRNNDSSRQAA